MDPSFDVWRIKNMKFNRKIFHGVEICIHWPSIMVMLFPSPNVSSLQIIYKNIIFPQTWTAWDKTIEILLLRIMKSFQITGQFSKSWRVLNSIKYYVFLLSVTIDWVSCLQSVMIGWQTSEIWGCRVWCWCGLQVFQGRLGQIWEFGPSRGLDPGRAGTRLLQLSILNYSHSAGLTRTSNQRGHLSPSKAAGNVSVITLYHCSTFSIPVSVFYLPTWDKI